MVKEQQQFFNLVHVAFERNLGPWLNFPTQMLLRFNFLQHFDDKINRPLFSSGHLIALLLFHADWASFRLETKSAKYREGSYGSYLKVAHEIKFFNKTKTVVIVFAISFVRAISLLGGTSRGVTQHHFARSSPILNDANKFCIKWSKIPCYLSILFTLCSPYVYYALYRVSQKSVPCVNENNSRNVFSSEKKWDIFESLKHVLIFLIYSVLKSVSVVCLFVCLFFNIFWRIFCILSPFHDIKHL